MDQTPSKKKGSGNGPFNPHRLHAAVLRIAPHFKVSHILNPPLASSQIEDEANDALKLQSVKAHILTALLRDC